MMARKSEITPSSGNVFADLGFATPEHLLVKAQLAHQISQAIEERGLTQKRAAELLGTDQSRISNLVRGQLENFSTDKLLRWLNLLGRDVEIAVREHRDDTRPASTRVVADAMPPAAAGGEREFSARR